MNLLSGHNVVVGLLPKLFLFYKYIRKLEIRYRIGNGKIFTREEIWCKKKNKKQMMVEILEKAKIKLLMS